MRTYQAAIQAGLVFSFQGNKHNHCEKKTEAAQRVAQALVGKKPTIKKSLRRQSFQGA
jgi:hypothetical protein